MIQNNKPQILLTNDDGIESPGLWAAAEALAAVGFVHVVAPRLQFSGAGRSHLISSDGIISKQKVIVHSKEWDVFSVGGTPAQSVLHALVEILPRYPDLVVSGINYGENVGSGVTISGTVGAALEAAAMGIPALAVSLETTLEHHLSYSKQVDFSVAAWFTNFFAHQILRQPMSFDVDILKVDVPAEATIQTPWVLTRQSRRRYFDVIPPNRADWNQPAQVGYQRNSSLADMEPGSDSYVLRVEKKVSVTPLSIDLTGRTDFTSLDKKLRQSS